MAVVSLIDSSYLTAGPVEVGAAVVPLLWALLSATLLVRAWSAEQESATRAHR